MKRIIAFFICITTIMTTLTTISVSAKSNFVTGKIGKNVNYKINLKTKTLTVYGKGKTYNYGSSGGYDFYDDNAPFFNDGRFEKVIVENGVTNIGINLFSFSGIKSIKLPNTIARFEPLAFSYTCLHTINIPESVKYIGPQAFRFCSNLKKITVDKNNKYFKTVDGVLYSKDMEVLYSYPSQMNNNKNFVMPDTVVMIFDHAFQFTNFKKITLSKNLEYIGEDAFLRNESITKLDIPEKVSEISEKSFSGMDKLEILTVSPNNPYFTVDNGVLYDKEKTELLYCTREAIRKKVLVTPKTLKKVDYMSFTGCSSEMKFDKIVFNEGLTYISDESEIISNTVVLPSTLKSFSASTFDSVKHLYFNGDVKKIKGLAFTKYRVYVKCTAKNIISHFKKNKKEYRYPLTVSHNFTKNYKYKAPTYFKTGYKKGYCSDCNKNINNKLKKLKLKSPKYTFKLYKSKKIKIKIKKVKDASYYLVKFEGSKKVHKVKGTTAVFKINENNTTFKVRAVKVSGKKIAYSSWNYLDGTTLLFDWMRLGCVSFA